jgi:hypothetical protein
VQFVTKSVAIVLNVTLFSVLKLGTN